MSKLLLIGLAILVSTGLGIVVGELTHSLVLNFIISFVGSALMSFAIIAQASDV